MELQIDLDMALVKVVGMTSSLAPTPTMLTIDPDIKPMMVNGLKGRAISYVPEEECYLVETFKGLHLCVPAANLEELEPTSIGKDGFDLAFPSGGMPLEDFAESLAHKLSVQHFCVVQMSFPEDRCREAIAQARSPSREWTYMIPEFEHFFLGLDPRGKVSWLDTDEPADLIAVADTLMDELAESLMPHSQELGFVAAGRSNGMLRMPLAPLDSEIVAEPEGGMAGSDLMSYVNFTRQGELVLMCFLSGSGGTLTLVHVDEAKDPTEILIEEGQLVVFNQRLMSFLYRPLGKDALVLQSWILRESLPVEAVAQDAAEVVSYDTSNAPKVPKIGQSGETVDCMSMAIRFLGNAWNAESCNTAFIAGLDGLTEVPTSRWDHAPYYDPDGVGGKAYCKHIGTCAEPVDAYKVFDYEFWGMTRKESTECQPCDRTHLESAFESCIRAGYTREKLRGLELGIACGYSTTREHFSVWQPEEDKTRACVTSTISSWLHAAFISCKLGFAGPAFITDTACSSGVMATALIHSMMRPQEPGKLKYQSVRQLRNGIAGASSFNCLPFFTMSLCGAKMLTYAGRCFTFDASGDGYVRSEGTADMFYQVHDKECTTRYAMMAGSAMNQDGRSANLTAPSGVSQQECIRLCLREAGIRALDIQIQELHGTGTPLGDPIEVGALRNTMMKEEGVVRSHPLVKTSSKAKIGHMELCAGMGGMVKCVLMAMFAQGHPGPHVRILNPNMDTAGYPALFAGEAVDQGTNWGFFGVSSFGFSGCNARGDIWGMATAGPRKALPVGWNLRETRHTRVAPFLRDDRAAVHQTPLGYEENWSGTFEVGNPFLQWTQFHISGTWSNWQSLEAPFAENDGVYEWAFRIGDTLSEDFRIHVNQYDDFIICPDQKQAASSGTLILGPGQMPKGYSWRVDGLRDGAKVGDMYVVKFWYDEVQKQKKISWELAPTDLTEELSVPFPQHRYYVFGSFNAWSFQELQKVGDSYQMSLRTGLDREKFQICCDRDLQRLIYPSQCAGPVNVRTDVAVRGPDCMGEGKYWSIIGKCGDHISLKLKISAGNISVSIISSKDGSCQSWTSSESK